MDYVKEYWAMVPFYNRVLLVLLPVIYLTTWVYPIHVYCVNNLDSTVYKYEGKIYFLLTKNSLEDIYCPIYSSTAPYVILCVDIVYSNWLYKGKDDWNCQNRHQLFLNEYCDSNNLPWPLIYNFTVY